MPGGSSDNDVGVSVPRPPTLPFSERNDIYNAATVPDSMRHVQQPEEPVAEKSAADNAATEEEDSVTATQPLELPFAVQIPNVEGFHILRPEEITPERRDRINEYITAGYHLQRILTEEKRGEPPAEYRERDSKLKVILSEAAPVGIILLALASAVFAGIVGLIVGASWLVVIIALLAVMAVSSYFGYRIYWIWANTYRISTVTQLGFERPANKWLFVDQYNPTVPASAKTAGTPKLNILFRIMHINAWSINMDTNIDQDGFLHNQRFVRDGLRYKMTAEANTRYALAA